MAPVKAAEVKAAAEKADRAVSPPTFVPEAALRKMGAKPEDVVEEGRVGSKGGTASESMRPFERGRRGQGDPGDRGSRRGEVVCSNAPLGTHGGGRCRRIPWLQRRCQPTRGSQMGGAAWPADDRAWGAALPLRPSRRSKGKQPDVKLSFLEEFGAAVGTQTDEKRAGGSDFDVFGRTDAPGWLAGWLGEGRRQGRGEGPDEPERIRRPIACVRENRVAAWLHEGPFAGRFDDSSVYLPGWW